MTWKMRAFQLATLASSLVILALAVGLDFIDGD